MDLDHLQLLYNQDVRSLAYILKYHEIISNGHCHPPYPPNPERLPLTVSIVQASEEP